MAAGRALLFIYTICRNVRDKICRRSGLQGKNGVFEGVATTAAVKWLRQAELSRGGLETGLRVRFANEREYQTRAAK